MAGVSLDYLKAFASITGTAQDESLQAYLDMAWGEVVADLKCDIVQTDYPGASEDGKGDSGYYSGTGKRFLILRQKPVTEVANIWVDPSGYFGDNPDGAFATSTLLVYGTDYVVHWDGCLPGTSTQCSRRAIVERIGSVWPSNWGYDGMLTRREVVNRGNIKVAYTAGYPETSLPQALRAAVCMLAMRIRSMAANGAPMQSESLGGYSYSLQGPQAQGWPEYGTIRKALNSLALRDIPI